MADFGLGVNWGWKTNWGDKSPQNRTIYYLFVLVTEVGKVKLWGRQIAMGTELFVKWGKSSSTSLLLNGTLSSSSTNIYIIYRVFNLN